MYCYDLHPYKKGGKVLRTQNTLISAEYMPRYSKLYLTDRLVNDKDGHRHYYRYRLHTSDPTPFFDTMEYDIECPHCSGKLKLCGYPVDSYTQGEYRCPRCDEKEAGWRA